MAVRINLSDMFTVPLMMLVILYVTSSSSLEQTLISASTSPISSESHSFWTTGANMPTARSEIGAAVVDEKIYVVGGQDNQAKKLNVVEVYDSKSDKWSTAAPIPQAVDHAGVASYDGKLYVVGGSPQKSHVTDKLFIYDPMTNRWKEGNAMPTARTMLTVDFMNGNLYAVGGVNSSYSVVGTNEAYNPKTDTWVEKAPMPTARHHATSEVVDGKLYVVGGRLAGDGVSYSVKEALKSFANNEMYNPITNTWTKLEPMPTNRSSMAAASIGKDIYVFGGQSRVKTPIDVIVFGGKSRVTSGDTRGVETLFVGQPADGTFSNNEKYDTMTDTWTTEIPMPNPLLGLESVALGGKIYVIGGKPSLGNTVTDEVEIYNTDKS
jgi:N-acetylneuraminic acid mutarotase